MWLEKAWRARILPPAVFLKRFFAPEWVFIFGMPGGQYRRSGSAAQPRQDDLPAVLHRGRAGAGRVRREQLLVAPARRGGHRERHRDGLPGGVEGLEPEAE